jgi:hypothetical protein
MYRLIHPRIAVLAFVLGFSASSPVAGQGLSSAQNGPASGDSPVAAHAAATVHNHTVKLSWRASTPASTLPRDAVAGYNVYRSTRAYDRNPKRINSTPCAGTTYTDQDVEAGKTYFYVTRSVTAKGVESGPSNQIKVVVPAR